FMSDGSSQFARGREPVHSREIICQLSRSSFGNSATQMFIKGPDKQDRKHSHCRRYRQNFRAITLPCRRLAKLDGAARRQVTLADPPAIQFAPIEDRRAQPYRGDLDTAGGLAIQKARSDRRGAARKVLRRKHGPTDDAVPKFGIVEAEDRRVRGLVKLIEHAIAV